MSKRKEDLTATTAATDTPEIVASGGTPTTPVAELATSVDAEFFGDDPGKPKDGEPPKDIKDVRMSNMERSLRDTRRLVTVLAGVIAAGTIVIPAAAVVEKKKDEFLAGMYGAADALLDGLESSKISEVEMIEKTYTESVTAENERNEKLLSDLADNLTKAVEECNRSRDSEKTAILVAYEAAMAEIKLLDDAIATMKQASVLMAGVKPEVATRIEIEDIKPKIEERQQKKGAAEKTKSDSLLALESKIPALNTVYAEDLARASEQHAAELLLIEEAKQHALAEVEDSIAMQSAASNREIGLVNKAAELVGASQGSWARLNSYTIQNLNVSGDEKATREAVYADLSNLGVLPCDDNSQAAYVVECVDGMPSHDKILNLVYSCPGTQPIETDGRFIVHNQGFSNVNAGIICQYADGVFASRLQKD